MYQMVFPNFPVNNAKKKKTNPFHKHFLTQVILPSTLGALV